MLTVEMAHPANVEIIAPLFDLYRQFYQQPPDPEAAAAFIKERLEQKESVIFMACLHARPAGFTQLYPLFSSVNMCRSWVLNDLYVLPEYRQMGIGYALLEKAKAHARATGASGLLLETASDNLQAQMLYEKNGWVRESHFFYWYSL